MKLAPLLAVVLVGREVSSSSSRGRGLSSSHDRGSHDDDNNNARVSSSSAAPQSFAYATLIGAIDVSQPRTYMGPVANSLVAARSLRDCGSKADFVAMIDFLDDEQQEGKQHPGVLPEEGLMVEQGVHVVYLPSAKGGRPEMGPKHTHQFVSVTFRKFEVWRALLRYDRVQFLDGDVVPKVNMDYAFSILEGTPYTEAFGAGFMGSAQGGWFLATPNETTFDIFRNAARKGRDKETGLWNGRAARQWTQLKKTPQNPEAKGDGWDYLGEQKIRDQGLMYYYARYLSNATCAIFYYKHMESWHATSSYLDSERAVSEGLPKKKWGRRKSKIKPGFLLKNGDYDHYTGREKPWLNPQGPQQKWLKTFYEVKNATSPKFKMMLDLTFPLDRPDAGFHRRS